MARSYKDLERDIDTAFNAVYATIGRKAYDKREVIERVVKDAARKEVDRFFQYLASYYIDVAGPRPEDVTDTNRSLFTWKPLSEAYLRRKKNKGFWRYDAKSRKRRRKSRHLGEYFRGLSGVAIFGDPDVFVEFNEKPLEKKVQAGRGRPTKEQVAQGFVKALGQGDATRNTKVRTLLGYTATVTIIPFRKDQGVRGIGFLLGRLAQRKALDRIQLAKLRSRRHPYRALIDPVADAFFDRKIPDAVMSALTRQGFRTNVVFGAPRGGGVTS